MARESKAPVKLSSVVDASRYVGQSTAATLTVAVRVRPLVRAEIARGARRDIIRVLDNRVVLVLDPDEIKDYLDQVQNRTKEKRYTFDIAFGTSSTNRDVYNGTVRDLIGGVLQGINTTVFAYGATGSGKTYTMVGTHQDPGLMVLCLEKIFVDRDTNHREEDFSVTCSYLEVYNEIIYDLLVRNSSPLELREDPELGVVVAGLKHITVTSAAEIMSLLEDGNRRRKTEATDANASSSRSHAVLEITVRRTPKNHYKATQLRGKLSLVDLAGSERAAETNNAGQKLRDGANINRSLLALANCINALGKANSGKAAASYVPYRNSKLTRLLKDGLSGNSRTAMVATVSGSADQYHHSINTLKYADRAKEIKTHVVQNVGTVESHVADYQRIIDNLQTEVQDLRAQLIEREALGRLGPSKARTSEEDLLVLIGKLVEEMNDNIEERINLQKALFEIEDANLYNKHELGQLEEFLESGKGIGRDVTEARERRAEVLEATRENERERERYKSEIACNEAARKDIQARVQAIVDSNQSAAFLNLLSTFRLQALHLQELKFQMAVRDQIIGEQRQVIGNLWKIIDKSGLPREKVMAVAKSEGIIMDGLQGGDAGGAVPLSEALKAVKEEMGIPDNRGTPEHLFPMGGKRGSERQLRYRAWPSPNGAYLSGDGRSASADASPYGSSDDEGGGISDDEKSVRSDKSPLRGRGQLYRLGIHQLMPPPHPHPLNDRRSSIHMHLSAMPSGLDDDVGVPGAARRLGPPGAGGGLSTKGQTVSGAAPVAQGQQRLNGVGALSSVSSVSAPMPAAPMNGAGAGPGPGSVAPHVGRRRIPNAPISARKPEPGEPLMPMPPPLNAPSGRLEKIKSGRRAGQQRPKPAQDLGNLAAPGGEGSGGAGGGGGHGAGQPGLSQAGVVGRQSVFGRTSDAGAAGGPAMAAPGGQRSNGGGGGGGGFGPGGGSAFASVGALEGLPPDLGLGRGAGAGAGRPHGPQQLDPSRLHGRRRHTVAHDMGNGLAGGPGAEAAALDTSDEGFEGLTAFGSEGAPGARAPPAAAPDAINLIIQPPPQAPLNERLARLKGRLSGAAAIAALPLPGEGGPPLQPSPPQVLAGGVARR